MHETHLTASGSGHKADTQFYTLWVGRYLLLGSQESQAPAGPPESGAQGPKQ